MKRKYNNGTGSSGVNYVIDPNKTLSEYQLLMDKARAEGEGNVFANVAIPTMTALLTQFGPSLFNNKTTAALGATNASGSIEAEGGEILSTPSNEILELKGPKHENGGIDLTVEPGTQIFSDRIKIGGKTMADRKKARENILANLDKASSSRQGDKATRNSVNRMRSNVQAEEDSDLMIQELANKFTKLQNHFALGTGIDGVPPAIDADRDGIPDYIDASIGLNAYPLTTNLNPVVPNVAPMSSTEIDTMLASDTSAPSGVTLTPQDLVENNTYSNPNNAPETRSLLSRLFGPSNNQNKSSNNSAGYTPTVGDVTGLFGNLISTFGPLQNTLDNRAGDTPNINAFEDFGQDALDTNDRILGLVKSQAENAKSNIRRNAVATKRSARNTSRSVNTQRATDTLIDLESNNQSTTVDDNLSRQLMQILSNRSSLENTRDQVVMQGNQNRDLADRQDRDNFYTNKGRDIATMGQGIQETGKDLNAIAENAMYMKMLNQMSKYFQFDSQGNVIGINSNK